MKQEQLTEWAEHEITQALRAAIGRELADIQASKGQAYHPFDPGKTQEILAGLNGAEDTWTIIADLLEGDWTSIEEESEQHIGDLPTTG